MPDSSKLLKAGLADMGGGMGGHATKRQPYKKASWQLGTLQIGTLQIGTLQKRHPFYGKATPPKSGSLVF